MEKVILLALDGLSWNAINRLLNEGKLTNIKKIIQNGAYGIQKAEEPLISPRIWTSIFTGKKVDKHGIIDFYSKEEDLNASQIWTILQRYNKKIGIYRPLGAWSVQKVNGFFIPSFLAFTKDAYPTKYRMISELDQIARETKEQRIPSKILIKSFLKFLKLGFPLKKLIKIIYYSILLFFKKNPAKKLFLRKKIELTIHTNFFLKIIKKYNPEFAVLYENSCDSISHRYWYNFSKNIESSDILSKIYLQLDRFIGKLIKLSKRWDFCLVIVSDHGFENIDELRTEKGFLSIKIPELLSCLKIENDVYGISLARTFAFRLKINSKLSLKDLKERFESVKVGEKKIFKVYILNNFVIVKINTFMKDKREDLVQILDNERVPIEKIIDFESDNTGAHSSENGVFFAYGSNIKNNFDLNEIKPYDITPTILAILKVPIPSDCDGKVLEEIFKIAPQISYYDELENNKKEKKGLNDKEEEIIKKRLHSLGYL
ncbi:MAG: alkaline phosphatase family protein [Candidatus Helarchaeota archaeon]